MKIVVAATHSTGKTTFCKKIAKRKGYNYIHDIVREEAVKKGFAINENTPPEVQDWLITRQWELEKTTPEPWIADKCLFDYLVYGDLVLKDEGIDKLMKEIIRYFVDKNAKYDIVFYMPPEIPLEEDGVRSIDPEFQRKVDAHYREVLDERGIKYITITGSVKERVKKALEHLK